MVKHKRLHPFSLFMILFGCRLAYVCPATVVVYLCGHSDRDRAIETRESSCCVRACVCVLFKFVECIPLSCFYLTTVTEGPKSFLNFQDFLFHVFF